MSIYITQQQRTTDPIVVNLPAAFDHTPAVLVTPFWRGQGEPVGSIETVLTTNLNDECKITSGNEDPNYWVNILAIEPTLTSIGTLGVNAGVQPKMQAGQVSINFADHLKSNDPVVLLGPPKH